MARRPKGRRDSRTQGARAHAVIRGIESTRGEPLTRAQRQRIVAAAGAAPYPPRRGQPRKWARRVTAAKRNS